MKKFYIISLIIFLIFFTAIIKNSTKRIDDEIFATKENIRKLQKDFEKIQLEYDYLSSTEKLFNFQNSYFDNEFVKKNILEMKIIKRSFNEIKIDRFRLINE